MDPKAVRIEPLVEAHAPELFKALNHDVVGRFIGGPNLTTEEALVAWIRRVRSGPPTNQDESWLNFAVLVGDAVVGRVQATCRGGSAEIAYLLGPDYWGRG